MPLIGTLGKRRNWNFLGWDYDFRSECAVAFDAVGRDDPLSTNLPE
jgi:hypothetical protein